MLDSGGFGLSVTTVREILGNLLGALNERLADRRVTVDESATGRFQQGIRREES